MEPYARKAKVPGRKAGAPIPLATPCTRTSGRFAHRRLDHARGDHPDRRARDGAGRRASGRLGARGPTRPHRTHVGHRVPRSARLRTCVSHSWPCAHRHQYFLAEPAPTSHGRSGRFLVGCHSFAASGATASRLFVTDTRCPAQNGHPMPRTRSRTWARQTWSGPRAQRHHTGCALTAATSSGSSVLFFVGCHSDNS